MGGACTGLAYLTLSPQCDAFNIFPHVMDRCVHTGLAVPQTDSHKMYLSEVNNTFPRILDGGAHAGLAVP